ncbi:hypothetical protein GCM10022251_73940 [Phytohabitans flavus]|uniref:Uncharacterized protein n=1 Tax=Phytohabitans flavus TaxID=1076124 RepID=A0A6F8XL04_9ACTN|nr:hypothetical protein [Phytohabitans flavus]BCB74471.1 hypothetical protein Pflav_008810 [Phytohabitans flavus]
MEDFNVAGQAREDVVRRILLEMADLALSVTDGRGVSRTLTKLAADLDRAGDDRAERTSVLRIILAMYQQGMGGFQDFTLQDQNGVQPEQVAFQHLRDRLFAQTLHEL